MIAELPPARRDTMARRGKLPGHLAFARRGLRVTILTIVSIVLPAGCVVGPDFHPPPLRDLPKFFGVGSDAADGEFLYETTSVGNMSRWWENFHDPILNALIAKNHTRTS